jgi:hypothetical protein
MFAQLSFVLGRQTISNSVLTFFPDKQNFSDFLFLIYRLLANKLPDLRPRSLKWPEREVRDVNQMWKEI